MPARRRRVRQRRQHPSDLDQRHADPTQAGHQAGRGDLPSGIPAVAGFRVDLGRDQQPGAVVEPQGADRQPSLPGHLPDAAQFITHAVRRHTLHTPEL